MRGERGTEEETERERGMVASRELKNLVHLVSLVSAGDKRFHRNIAMLGIQFGTIYDVYPVLIVYRILSHYDIYNVRINSY